MEKNLLVNSRLHDLPKKREVISIKHDFHVPPIVTMSQAYKILLVLNMIYRTTKTFYYLLRLVTFKRNISSKYLVFLITKKPSLH